MGLRRANELAPELELPNHRTADQTLLLVADYLRELSELWRVHDGRRTAKQLKAAAQAIREAADQLQPRALPASRKRTLDRQKALVEVLGTDPKLYEIDPAEEVRTAEEAQRLLEALEGPTGPTKREKELAELRRLGLIRTTK